MGREEGEIYINIYTIVYTYIHTYIYINFEHTTGIGTSRDIVGCVASSYCNERGERERAETLLGVLLPPTVV